MKVIKENGLFKVFFYCVAKTLQIIQIPRIRRSKLGKNAKVCFKSLLLDSEIGNNTYIAENTTVIHSRIGNFSSIASDCYIGGAGHPIDWISTSPVFEDCKSVLKNKINPIQYNPYKITIIGNDVWIGTHSLIKGGVTIGDGAIIGMGSVVTKDVGRYEIWGGIQQDS